MPQLDELLDASDFVTLHVPETRETRSMIGADRARGDEDAARTCSTPRRGTVVDIDALADALMRGHLARRRDRRLPGGAGEQRRRLRQPLRGLPNVILTPHIGGSTVEAQANIGREVARKLIESPTTARPWARSTSPRCQLPAAQSGSPLPAHPPQRARRALRTAERGLRDRATSTWRPSTSRPTPSIGYVVFDVDGEVDDQEILADIRAIEGTLRARVLYDRRS